ncbi:MAG: hypothetical protein ABSE95_11895 [Thermodesulfobacteriota bacterium]
MWGAEQLSGRLKLGIAPKKVGVNRDMGQTKEPFYFAVAGKVALVFNTKTGFYKRFNVRCSMFNVLTLSFGLSTLSFLS